MTTHVCPACGYPTLKPDLCAFCCPGEVFSGDPVFGASPFAATLPNRATWASAEESHLVAQSGSWSGPVAS